ncbi:hypothetical protein N0V83_006731 [Neocucurbitaria cava]|uniref:FAD-binding PCMH-type domain-containing protein n=1 Tax=Neocucurbitaria cava TaxID=798079 RepID=A0A9W8Y5E2_9PLEO|nr:hypothetical protein N0V83_006731 [Neocucurbitaria cava]
MSVSEAIQALKAISASLVVLPGSDEYKEISRSYLSTVESDLEPAAFALPSTKDDVAAILKALKPFDNKVPIAICGGGQQPAAGVANVAGGITIHLRRFKGIELSQDKTFVSISPGETWGEVYKKLEPEGLAVSGSRAGTGGIGGLSTHGGISFFSSERGFIADDVVNYEIVLASGDVVGANAKEHSDLFKALKGGGGSNFGIITRFDFTTFKQGKMWGGKFMYFPASFPQQLEGIAEYLNGPNPDPRAQVRINIGYAAELGGMMCMNDPTYTKPEKPEGFSLFTDVEPRIPQVDTLRVATVSELANEQSEQSEYKKRVIYLTTTLKANAEVLKMTLEKFNKGFEPIKSVAGLIYAATYEPYPVSLLKASTGNSLGLDANDGPLVLFLLYTSWSDTKDDDAVIKANKEVLGDIKKEAEAMGQLSPYTYMNYSFPGQDPISSYGPEIKKQLQAVSQKYDPEGFFQKAVSGGFKLF